MFEGTVEIVHVLGDHRQIAPRAFAVTVVGVFGDQFGERGARFFQAVESIDSAFERGRVLKAVADRSDASSDTILAVLHATKGVSSSFEASQVLLAVASSHPVAGQARDAYIDAAEKLGDFEQGRVLAALVKNERRR